MDDRVATAEGEQIRGRRVMAQPFDDGMIEYLELYDEMFSRAEQSIGAQLRPIEEPKVSDYV